MCVNHSVGYLLSSTVAVGGDTVRGPNYMQRVVRHAHTMVLQMVVVLCAYTPVLDGWKKHSSTRFYDRSTWIPRELIVVVQLEDSFDEGR